MEPMIWYSGRWENDVPVILDRNVLPTPDSTLILAHTSLDSCLPLDPPVSLIPDAPPAAYVNSSSRIGNPYPLHQKVFIVLL